MAYIQVEVEIDIEEHLDEVSVSDLIYELSQRKLTVKDRKDLELVISGVSVGSSQVNTLIAELKMETVLRGLKDKSLTEVQEFFK